MGQVFRAVDARLHRTVAVKILPPTDAINPRLRERFGREAQAGARSLTRTSARYTTSAPAMASTSSSWSTSREIPSRHASRKRPLPLDRALQCAIEWPMRLITRIATGSCTGT